MFNKWRRYSYRAQKQQQHKILWILVWLIALFLIIAFLQNFVFKVIVLKNENMLPGLHRGDRLVVLSYGFYRLFPSLAEKNGLPLRRGNIILVDTSLEIKHGFFIKLTDSLTRFFTVQQHGLINLENSLYIKRILGLPGDEVSMEGYILRVKSAERDFGLTEYEMANTPYDLNLPAIQWDESLPFSGTMDTIKIMEGKCFVMSDDRSNTNDSRTWGPIPLNIIYGRVIFRYWPITRIGTL